jgi:hypothetical protein
MSLISTSKFLFRLVQENLDLPENRTENKNWTISAGKLV